MSMEKEEADNNLRQAIIDHAKAYEMGMEDDFLNHYAVVAHWQTVEDCGCSSYTNHFHTDTIPNHIAVGLLQNALNHLTRQKESG